MVARMTEGIGGTAYPCLGLSLGHRTEGRRGRHVSHSKQIGLAGVFPTILIFLGDAATTLRETCIAYLIAIHENLSTGGGHCIAGCTPHLLGNALIALTVVVGSDIEKCVVLAAVPADELIIFLHKREEAVLLLMMSTAALHLCQQPRTGDDSMGLEQFHR